jgi:hypothetical protein
VCRRFFSESSVRGKLNKELANPVNIKPKEIDFKGR